MQDIDLFLPDVLGFVPNCPDLMAYRWIREAATTICKKTKLWRQPDEFNVDPDDYQGICTIPDASIFEITAASLDGVDLEPVTNDQLDCVHKGWQFDTTEGAARYITQIKPDTVTVVPRCAGTLQARLVLTPSRTALQLADFLLEHHSLLVAKGAAAQLLKLPKTDFENPNLALNLGGEFNAELTTLAVKALKGQHGAPLRTRSRW